MMHGMVLFIYIVRFDVLLATCMYLGRIHAYYIHTSKSAPLSRCIRGGFLTWTPYSVQSPFTIRSGTSNALL